MNTLLALSLVAMSFFGLGCGALDESPSTTKEAWNPSNDPSNLGAMQNGQIDYRQIPNQAVLPTAKMPWGAYYWPTYRGGISYRFQQFPEGKKYQDFLYEIPPRDRVAALTTEEIAKLSPSEKFDLALNRLDLPLTRRERQEVLGSVVNGQIPEWWGLCHGWSNASYSEARMGAQVVVTNSTNQQVTFYADDLKALLAKAYANFSAPIENALFVGDRCNETLTFDPQGRVINSSACRDSNPGSFHLVITEYLATRQESLIADVDSGEEVWNYPLIGYSYTAANERAFNPADPFASVRAPNTKYLVDIHLTLNYRIDQIGPSAAPVPDYTASKTYDYTLELDESRRIIGGEWSPHSKERPDFLWRIRNRPAQSGVAYLELDKIRELIAASIGG